MKTGQRESQTCSRKKDAADEELWCTRITVEVCSRGHQVHLHCGKLKVILLLASQPGPAKPFSPHKHPHGLCNALVVFCRRGAPPFPREICKQSSSQRTDSMEIHAVLYRDE